MNLNRRAAILGGQRTPFVKSFTSYQKLTNQDLMTAALSGLVSHFRLKGQRLGDVALGSVIKNSSDWNLARESVLGCGLDAHTPAYDVQRACGTSLETAWQIGLKISAGQIDVGIAGGSDTNSDLPVMLPRKFARVLLDARNAKGMAAKLKVFSSFRPHHFKLQFPGVVEPRTGLSMGDHCEKMVKEWKISRRDQDELAYRSHQNAAKAYAEGFFADQLCEVAGIKKDGFVRADTSVEKLAKLKPAFDFSGAGTLTAGNSTPLTDGAAAVLMSSEDYAKQKNLKPLAFLKDVEVAAVDFVEAGEGLLMAPTIAVSRLLDRNQLKLQDFDFYEIHEAFAGQVLCTLRAWESTDYCKSKIQRNEALGSIDLLKMNIKGGSLAIGHPFGATGARTVMTMAKLLDQKGSGRGLISICTGGGMGIAAILER
ncbi:MAG: acetyl-CoA C-acetyltransferase [Deltaproteobacteria bacterium]|nr:acetyl-CoA C-acetyltransferase [Deltaproteobacteria bacterium]